MAAFILLSTTAFADEVDNILSRVENYFNTGYYYEARNELNWLYQYHGDKLTYGRDNTAKYYSDQVDYAIKYMDKVFAWFDKIDSYYNKGLYKEAKDELTWLYDTYNLTPSQLTTWNKKKSNIDSKIEQAELAKQLADSPAYTHSVSAWLNKIDEYYSNGYYYEARNELTWLKDTYKLNASQLSEWNKKRDNINYAIKYMDNVFNWFGKVESYYNKKLYYEARDELTWLKDTYKLTPSQTATWNKWKTAINNKLNALAEARAKEEASKVYYYNWYATGSNFKIRSAWNYSKANNWVKFYKGNYYYYYNIYNTYFSNSESAVKNDFKYTSIISQGYETINHYAGYQMTFKVGDGLGKVWGYVYNGRFHYFDMYTSQSSWPDELYNAFYETLGSVSFY